MNSALGVRRLACIAAATLAIAFSGCCSCTQPSTCGGGGGLLSGGLFGGGCNSCGGGCGGEVVVSEAGGGVLDSCGGCGLGGGACGCGGGMLGNLGGGATGGLLGGGSAAAQDIANKFGTMCEGGPCNRPPPPGMGYGMPGAQVRYPYYTTRGPRDFLMANPPSIGP